MERHLFVHAIRIILLGHLAVKDFHALVFPWRMVECISCDGHRSGFHNQVVVGGGKTGMVPVYGICHVQDTSSEMLLQILVLAGKLEVC